MILKIKTFFFNAKTDYLPYYKNYKIEVEPSTTIGSTLQILKSLNRDFNYPKDRLFFRVNGKIVDGNSTTIVQIVDRFGIELTIEPLSKYRCIDDIVIEDSDFEQSYKLLEPFCNDEDRAYYEKLYPLHYASATYEYNKQYIGDAILILASRLIFNKNPHKDEILDIISDDNALWDAEWESSMFDNVDYKDTFNLLKNLAKSKKDINKVSSFCAAKYRGRDLSLCEEVGVAFYYGLESNEIFELSSSATSKRYKEVNYIHSNKSCGIDLLKTNQKLALTKAARVLADAYDSGAGLLLADKKYIDYFKDNFGKIQRVANRDILINLQDIDTFSI